MKLLGFWYSLEFFLPSSLFQNNSVLAANFLKVALIHNFQQGLPSKFFFWSYSRLKCVPNWWQFHWAPKTCAQKCLQYTHSHPKWINYELNVYSFKWQFCFFHAKSLFHLDFFEFSVPTDSETLVYFYFLCLSVQAPNTSQPGESASQLCSSRWGTKTWYGIALLVYWVLHLQMW